MENLNKLIDRCNEMDIPEQIAAFHNANLPYDAKLELAALREAGEKMKAALEYIQEVEDLWGKSYDKSNAALAEWEAANK